jgi:hypothetical protein
VTSPRQIVDDNSDFRWMTSSKTTENDSRRFFCAVFSAVFREKSMKNCRRVHTLNLLMASAADKSSDIGRGRGKFGNFPPSIA